VAGLARTREEQHRFLVHVVTECVAISPHCTVQIAPSTRLESRPVPDTHQSLENPRFIFIKLPRRNRRSSPTKWATPAQEEGA
jgi:hypothetical protein